MRDGAAVERADGKSHNRGSGHGYLKQRQRRRERRRAKREPECVPAYGKYVGYET